MKSASNREITLLRKLNRKKYREKNRLFLIEGFRGIQQIIENGFITVDSLFVDESQSDRFQREWRGQTVGAEEKLLSPDIFREVADTDNPQGIIGLCRMPEEAGVEYLCDREGVIIAADAIQDPGNLGTMIRTSGWFGVKGLLLGKGTVDLFHPKVVRSTAGATGAVPYCNVVLQDDLEVFEDNGWQVFLLDAGTGARDLREINFPDKTVLVTGNEANGISASLFKDNREKVIIPPASAAKGVESLNAAIALSIALYASAD